MAAILEVITLPIAILKDAKLAVEFIEALGYIFKPLPDDASDFQRLVVMTIRTYGGYLLLRLILRFLRL